MLQVNSCQFNYQYGDQIHFPYSIACLVSYLKQFDWVNKHFEFEKTFVFRDKLDDYVNECWTSDVLLCSCYVWNWEITNELARRVRKNNPNCLIIFGGPQVPNHIDENFFHNHPYVDIFIHTEGELILGNVLDTLLKDGFFDSISYRPRDSVGIPLLKVNGISTRRSRNPKEDRIEDLGILPSPYLTNEVWRLVEKVDGIRWISSWESNRGCPYKCTFCDWGSATYTKLRKYPEDRLHDEIKWFGNNEIIYVDCCDANWGILGRDLELSRRMKEIALETQYPQTFRQSWAKMSSEKIIPVAQELKDGGLLAAVGLAVESLDENTLQVIKRSNIKFDKFSDLTKEFKSKNLPTYTEIIRALPGETLDSFKNNLEELVANSEIGAIYIYNCCVLPNAPLNEPSYRKEHGIKDTRSPIYLAHSSIENRGITEYEYIVTETATASKDDVKKMFLYSWLILTFQNLGLFEYITKYFNKEYDLSFMEFYDYFIEFCKTHSNIFSEEFDKVIDYIDNGYAGEGWDHYDSDLGPIYWPIEEASWLRLTKRKVLFTNAVEELFHFVCNKLNIKDDHDRALIAFDLIRFQSDLLTLKDSGNEEEKEIITNHFLFNWLDYFDNNENLEIGTQIYKIPNKYPKINNNFEWNKNVIWYGRRKQIYKVSLNEIEIVE